MEKLSYLFNADYEDHLFSGNFSQHESSKVNQEFEYFIHWLYPEHTIFTSKKYDGPYLCHLKKNTGKDLKTVRTGRVKLFCQNFEQACLKKKLSDKFSTAKFMLSSGLNPYPINFISDLKKLKTGFLYKAPTGVSGSGHFQFPNDLAKITKTLNGYDYILEEPIIARERDFSTLIENKKRIVSYENYVDERFQYKGSYFTPSFSIGKKLDLEYENAIKLVLDYANDYDGIMSIDGFSFDEGKKINPCCEINSRKTMGYVAFKFWQKYFGNTSHFKFLLFKNTYSKPALEAEFFYKESSSILLSPSSNRFLVFAFAGNREKEIYEKEKLLSATLLKCV